MYIFCYKCINIILLQTNLFVHIHGIKLPLCVDVQVIQDMFCVQHKVCKVDVVTVVVVVCVPVFCKGFNQCVFG